jgi:anti-sigma regulatory factor (Ser/Thr protein kinase)
MGNVVWGEGNREGIRCWSDRLSPARDSILKERLLAGSLEGAWVVRPLIEKSLVARPTAASEARKHLSVIADKVPPEKFDDVRLLVSELVTNSVKYSGQGTGEALLVGFAVKIAPDRLRVEVADAGKGFDKNVTPVRLDPGSGWGLRIVDQLSDRWGVEKKNGLGSTVWFEIDL